MYITPILIIIIIIYCIFIFKNMYDNVNIIKYEYFSDNIKDYSVNQLWNPKWLSNFNIINNIPQQNYKIAQDCYKLSPNSCIKYPNCGLCINENNMSCVPGDEDGPLFTYDCSKWFYGNFFDRYIFGDKLYNIVTPWNVIPIEYLPGLPSPNARTTL